MATPRLHAARALKNQGLHYAILDYLDGDPDDHSDEWFSALGHSLGASTALPGPTRLTGMDPPLGPPWTSAFAQSLVPH